MLRDYLAVAALIFAINLLPAFGPPTSAVLVAFTLNFDLAPVPLVATGAVAAASGRFVLATHDQAASPPPLGEEALTSLAAAQRYLESNRARTAAGLGLFALSPVPSGQLFVAAGLMTVRLLPLTLSFFAGRLVSYTLYVSGAHALKGSVGDQVLDGLTSPLGLALQALALVALVLLLRLDWVAILERRGPASPSPPPAPAQAARTSAVDLYWIPLGAGGHSVRLNGRVFEAIEATWQRRERCDLYHAALVVQLEDQRYSIEIAPSPDADESSRGVVGTGAVGSRHLGRLRLFRYEVRCWPGGSIPDLGEAVGGAGPAHHRCRDGAPDTERGASRAAAGVGPRRAGGGRDVELELGDRMAARHGRCVDRFAATAATRPGARMVRRSRGGSAPGHLGRRHRSPQPSSSRARSSASIRPGSPLRSSCVKRRCRSPRAYASRSRRRSCSHACRER